MLKQIRCNECFTRAEFVKKPFNLTECGHIFCDRCIDQAKKQCIICHTIGAPSISLQEPLNDNIAIFFKSMKETSSLVLRVATFQEEQLDLFIKRFDEINEKYVCIKQAYINMEMGILKIHKKYKQEKSEDKKKIRKLEQEIMELRLAIEKKRQGPFHYINGKTTVPTSARGQQIFIERQPSNAVKFKFANSCSSRRSNCYMESANLGKVNHRHYAESGSVFRVPNSGFVPRSTMDMSTGGTNNNISASTYKLPSRFDSMNV